MDNFSFSYAFLRGVPPMGINFFLMRKSWADLRFVNNWNIYELRKEIYEFPPHKRDIFKSG